MLTKEYIDQLEAITNAATPGPWDPRYIYGDGGSFSVICYSNKKQESVRLCKVKGDLHRQDAYFIAETRTAIPELIKYIRELETELIKLTNEKMEI